MGKSVTPHSVFHGRACREGEAGRGQAAGRKRQGKAPSRGVVREDPAGVRTQQSPDDGGRGTALQARGGRAFQERQRRPGWEQEGGQLCWGRTSHTTGGQKLWLSAGKASHWFPSEADMS